MKKEAKICPGSAPGRLPQPSPIIPAAAFDRPAAAGACPPPPPSPASAASGAGGTETGAECAVAGAGGGSVADATLRAEGEALRPAARTARVASSGRPGRSPVTLAVRLGPPPSASPCGGNSVSAAPTRRMMSAYAGSVSPPPPASAVAAAGGACRSEAGVRRRSISSCRPGAKGLTRRSVSSSLPT